MRLIGREFELASCRAALDPTGPQAGMVITGEAGIGKTALHRAALARAAARGHTCCRRRGGPRQGPLALGGLADLLEPGAREVLHQLPDVQADALRAVLHMVPAGAPVADGLLIRATVNVLRAMAAPRVLVAVDDEQWLDADTRRLLCLAAGWLPQSPSPGWCPCALTVPMRGWQQCSRTSWERAVPEPTCARSTVNR